MNVSLRIKDDRMVLAVAGWFDLSVHYEFFDLMEEGLANSGITTIEIDLSQTTHIDSSGLGMLSILRSKAKEAHIREVILTGATGMVKKTLGTFHFDKMFHVA